MTGSATATIRSITLVTLLGLISCSGMASRSALLPDPALAPSDVVRLQVEALGRNAAVGGDGGIRTAFVFASPSNRRTTGPEERFIALLHDPGYRALLNHRGAVYGATVREGSRAAVRVTVTTLDMREVGYVFVLSRETTAACDGCWLTDAVYPWPGEYPAGPRRVGA